MDTNKRKKKRIIPTEPNRMTVIGIYEDPEKGILIVKKDDGSFELPGGKIWRRAKHGQTKKQLKAEENKLTRTVFEKCGLSLDVEASMGLYNIKNPATDKFKLYKVYILAQNSTPANKTWKRSDQFDGEFIPADLDLILEKYPELSESDKNILAEYFNWYPQEAAKDNGREYPKEVKIIA